MFLNAFRHVRFEHFLKPTGVSGWPVAAAFHRSFVHSRVLEFVYIQSAQVMSDDVNHTLEYSLFANLDQPPPMHIYIHMLYYLCSTDWFLNSFDRAEASSTMVPAFNFRRMSHQSAQLRAGKAVIRVPKNPMTRATGIRKMLGVKWYGGLCWM